MELGLAHWFAETLRAHPELAVFFALAIGFAAGAWKVGGFTLGNVTATLLAGVLIGQLGITVAGPIKSTFFLMFLFAVGYGVGPQFFRGLGKEGPRQIGFSLIVLTLCLAVPVLCAMVAGLDVGYAAGLYAGSQTISAAIGVATDQIDRLGYSAAQAKAYADAVPIGYAVTYIFGTIGSAIVLAQLGPKLIGVDLAAACAEYERQLGAGSVGLDAGVMSAYRHIELRAYRIDAASGLTGRPVRELFPGLRVFVERVRRGDELIDADADTVLQPGDVAAILGARQLLVEQIEAQVPEVHDPVLLELAGDGGGRVRDEPGVQRQDGAAAGRGALCTRRPPATDHTEHGRDPDPAGDRNPARRHPDRRGQRPPRRGGRQGARVCRSAARVHRSDDRRRRHRRRRADRRASACSGVAFRSACPHPAARCWPA